MTATDNDPDGTVDPTTVQIIDPNTGNPVTTFTVAGEGEWTINPLTGEITFTPESGFTGDPAPISYTVEDNDGNLSNPATVTVTYGDAPEATDDMQHNPTLGSDTVINVIANDNDPDGTLNPATIEIAGSGGPGLNLVIPSEGTWSVDTTTGAITFSPEAGYTDDPAPIQYTVEDDVGNPSNQATITVTYGEAPIATDDTKKNQTIGTPTVVDLVSNDGDSDGNLDLDSVQISGTTNPGDSLTVPNQGVWTINPGTGSVTFTPDPSFRGNPSPIGYTISDNDGNVSNEAIVSVTYGLPPVAVDDNVTTTVPASSGQPIMIDVIGGSGSDSDPEGMIDPSSVDLDPSTPGIDSIFTNADGTYTVDAFGVVTFTPVTGLSRSPQPISYTVNDMYGNTSNVAMITIMYAPESIPTLSEWALVVLMMLLGIVGYRQGAKRNVKRKAF